MPREAHPELLLETRRLRRGELPDALELLDAGTVRYGFKRPWKDGSTAVHLHPFDLLARLCALIPPPRMHVVRYHGVLSSHVDFRSVFHLGGVRFFQGAVDKGGTVLGAYEIYVTPSLQVSVIPPDGVAASVLHVQACFNVPTI